MQCSKVQEQIPALVASEYSRQQTDPLNPRSLYYQDLSNWQRRRLQRHCHACSACRTEWEQTQQLWVGMKSLAVEAAPEPVRAAIFAALPASAQTVSSSTPASIRSAILPLQPALPTAGSPSFAPSFVPFFLSRLADRWQAICEAPSCPGHDDHSRTGCCESNSHA